jgi:hypothetical protein
MSEQESHPELPPCQVAHGRALRALKVVQATLFYTNWPSGR